MIVIGGMIGIGLFFGLGSMILKMGLLVMWVYLVLGFFFFLMMWVIGEMFYFDFI